MQRKIDTDFQGAVAWGGWLQLLVCVEFCARLDGVTWVCWLRPAPGAARLGTGFWQVRKA